jgi:hypothetical protein
VITALRGVHSVRVVLPVVTERHSFHAFVVSVLAPQRVK